MDWQRTFFIVSSLLFTLGIVFIFLGMAVSPKEIIHRLFESGLRLVVWAGMAMFGITYLGQSMLGKHYLWISIVFLTLAIIETVLALIGIIMTIKEQHRLNHKGEQ